MRKATNQYLRMQEWKRLAKTRKLLVYEKYTCTLHGGKHIEEKYSTLENSKFLSTSEGNKSVPLKTWKREPQRSDLVCSEPCFVKRLEGTSRIHPVQPQIFPSFYSLKEFPSSCNNRSDQWLLRSGWGHHKSDHRRGQIVLLITISKKNDKLTNHTHNGEAVFANSRQTSYVIVRIQKF